MIESLLCKAAGDSLTDTQFFWQSTIQESDFLPYQSVVELLSPSTAFTKSSEFKYFRFKSSLGKEVVVPSHPIGRDSYQNLYLKGGVFGVDGDGVVPPNTTPTNQKIIISVSGSNYLVRAVKGVPKGYTVKSGTSNTPDFYPLLKPEYDQFMVNIWKLSDNVKTRIFYEDHGVPETDKVVKTNPTGSTTSNLCTQGHYDTATIGRGRFDTRFPDGETYPFKYAQLTTTIGYTSSASVWWPVFEKV